MQNLKIVNTLNELRLIENITILKGFIEDQKHSIEIQEKYIGKLEQEIQNHDIYLKSKNNYRDTKTLKIV